MANLPADLERERQRIEGYAREYGLDFYDVVFEVLDYDHLNEVASYGGFPTRYPHWRFGMEYEELAKSYSYGLSKIYELVINNNPVYAYLMKANATVEQKVVMAHVFGHADFFKNNLWFAKTNRRMIDQMANHATRVRHHIDRYGVEAVEDFIDACLSLENLIDYHADFVERREKREPSVLDRDDEPAGDVPKLKSKPYMDSYINPPEFLEEQKARMVERAKRRRNLPEEPERDVVRFLLEHAPLENWERDVLAIVRDEARYFAPQGMTKIMNEGWACVVADTPVFTSRGLVPMAEVVAADEIEVADGAEPRAVYDRHVIRDHEVVRVRTRRGLVLAGSRTHRVLLADGTWRTLADLTVGASVRVAGGSGLWPTRLQHVSWAPAWHPTLDDVAAQVGVSVSSVLRHRAGQSVQAAAALSSALESYIPLEGRPSIRLQRAISVPALIDEPLAAFLGYLVGDGHISEVKGHAGLTTADDPQAEHFTRLASDLFGLTARRKQDGGRQRVIVHSEQLVAFLRVALGMKTGLCARAKTVPDAVLRSPASVVRAFLRAYFDCDGHAGAQGVILSTASERLGSQVQLLLLNFGILSRRRLQRDGCWHVHVSGPSAAVFAERVGFGLARKQARLESYVADRRWFKEEPWTDEVVQVTHERGDVYDISVAETHRYAAAGLVNHNSYHHALIMTRRALRDSEVIDFADTHAGTMVMGPGQFNPYKLGVEIWREIEDRWNKGRFGKDWDACDDHEARRRWDRKLGLGRQKMFEVRRIYNDVMFVDAFLDEAVAERLKLYVYGWDPRSGRHVVVSRDWRKVKEKLLFQLTNMGQPIIEVVDANHANRGELYLKHRFEGMPLDAAKARDTLRNLFRIWRRPVHIETMEDDRGRLLSYDGVEAKSTRL